MICGWHWYFLLGRNISRTTANNLRIICICPDNVWMTCTYADNMWTMSRCDMQRKPSIQIISQSFTWSWNETTQHSCKKFHSITRSCQSRKIVQVHADHEEFCRWCVDDICCCRQHVDDVHACRWHVDDMQMTCGQHAVNICHPPAEISNKVSLSCHLHVVCTSSAHRLHETSVPRLFWVKQQRTALLKSDGK